MSRNSRQPSKALRREVKLAFDPAALKATCEAESLSFGARGNLVTLPGKDRFYVHVDNGSSVLAVAHLDTVQANRACTVADTGAGYWVGSGALDDRLGAYVILHLLPALGVNVDVLLTTDEEIARSTASEFIAPKAYNWAFSFDRGGTDVVAYQYHDRSWDSAIEDSGARVGRGSYSDIADLEHLGVKCANWGVGYQDYHGARSHAWLEDTFRMVARFVKFYRTNVDVKWEHHEPHYSSRYSSRGLWDLDRWGRVTDDRALRELFDDIDPFDDRRDDDGTFADCGHWVDLNDEDTYIETLRPKFIVCMGCSMDYVEWDSKSGGWVLSE